MYLAHANNVKVLKLNEELRKKDAVLADAKKEIDNLQKILPATPTPPFLQKEIERLNAVLHEKDDEMQKLRSFFRERDSEVQKLRNILRERDNELLRQGNLLRDRNNEVFMLKHTVDEKDNQIWELKSQTFLTVKPPQPSITLTSQPKTPPTQSAVSPQPPPVSSKRFIQVIFKKRGKKRYDYLLGDNKNINVGDFVVVHVNINGKTTWKIAKVVYISSPNEVSLHAKSALIKKADYDKW